MKVVIVTWDRYSWLVPISLHFYKIFWPDNPYQTEYVSETIEVKGESTFCTGKLPWADRVIMYLNAYKEERLLLLLDDYIIRSPVHTSIVQQAEKLCVSDIGQVRLCPYNRWCHFLIPSEFCAYKEYPLDKPYSVSFIPSIWQKDFLLECLRKGESIFSTETEGSKRICTSKKRILHSDFPAISCEGLAGFMKKAKIVKPVMDWVELYWPGNPHKIPSH